MLTKGISGVRGAWDKQGYKGEMGVGECVQGCIMIVLEGVASVSQSSLQSNP